MLRMVIAIVCTCISVFLFSLASNLGGDVSTAPLSMFALTFLVIGGISLFGRK